MKQGYGGDYATGKPVDLRKPEEVMRQNYEKELHEDYEYAREQMDKGTIYYLLLICLITLFVLTAMRKHY